MITNNRNGIVRRVTSAAIALGVLAGAQIQAKTAELTLEAGKLIEVAYLTIKDGHEKQLKTEYFSKVMPVAMEYGGRRLGTFSITATLHGPSDAKTVALFDWPSLEQKKKFENDARYQKLQKVRDKHLSYLAISYTMVEETSTVPLNSDRVYEFATVWVNSHDGNLLKPYLGGMMGEIKKHGGEIQAKFGVMDVHTGYDSKPSLIVMADWPNAEVCHSLFDSAAFKEHGWMRAKALDCLILYQTSYNFE